ncbi:hypothetical protein ACLOJK_024167 [Asimina triloba]
MTTSSILDAVNLHRIASITTPASNDDLINTGSIGRRREPLGNATPLMLPTCYCRREGEKGAGGRQAMSTLLRMLAVDGADKGSGRQRADDRRTTSTQASHCDGAVEIEDGGQSEEEAANSTATEETSSALLAAVGDIILRPHRICDELDVGNMMND